MTVVARVRSRGVAHLMVVVAACAMRCRFDVTLASRRDDASLALDAPLDASRERDDAGPDAESGRDDADAGPGRDARADGSDEPRAPLSLRVQLRGGETRRGMGSSRRFVTRAVIDASPLLPGLSLVLVGDDGAASEVPRVSTRFELEVPRYGAQWELRVRADGVAPTRLRIDGLAAHAISFRPERGPVGSEPLVVAWGPAGGDGAAVLVGSQPEVFVADRGAYSVPAEALRGSMGPLREFFVGVRRWKTASVREGPVELQAYVEISASAEYSAE